MTETVLHWAVDQFRYDRDGPTGPSAPHEIDLSGRRRILIWGPYVALPKGRWRVRTKLSFDRRATSYNFAVEFGSAAKFERLDFRPEKAGLYEVELEFGFDGKKRAELRVIIDQGVVGGQLGFYGADVEIVGTPEADEIANP
ncbi:MAG: hypothetical protein ACRYFE_03730 [Janthinobacterium lividum]